MQSLTGIIGKPLPVYLLICTSASFPRLEADANNAASEVEDCADGTSVVSVAYRRVRCIFDVEATARGRDTARTALPADLGRADIADRPLKSEGFETKVIVRN